MASAFIFLIKFFFIFVIQHRVNANEHHSNCEVNKTAGVITEIRLRDSPTNLNCNSGGSQKAWQSVNKIAHGASLQFRDNKNWMALDCKVAGSDSNATFCFHGPNNPPTISGSNTLVSGVPTDINCTINGVFPAPKIEWYLGDTENITMNASAYPAYYDNNTSLFSATSSLSFTPKLEDDGRLLTCNVTPSVPNIRTPSNASVELSVIDESDISAVVQVDEATSSSLYISWLLHEGNMSGSSMLTLKYCQNSNGDFDNVETLDNPTCPTYKKVPGLNRTSYNLTGLQPFEWYDLTLLADGNTVASKMASTAPLSPEYYGVYLAFSPEKEILEISRLPMMNSTVPSGVCFAIIQTEGSKTNCSSPSLKCVDPGSKINNFKEEDIPKIGLVSSGRGLCSQPTLHLPIILNSTHMDMPHVSIVMGAVVGVSVFILLSTVALLLFLNFICKGIGCLGKKDEDIDEDETLVQVIRKDNSRKVDKDGLVYVDIAHEKSHPADAPPIRTEEPTVYALVETGVMGSCKKDDDGLVYVEVSHEHDHPAGAPPIQTEKPTVYATLDMEAMASLKEKEGKEEMGGAKDGEEGAMDKKESVKEKKKSVKEENKDVKDDKEGVKEEKEVVGKKKESVKEKKKSVKKESKDVKDDKEGVKEEKEKVEKEKEGGEKAPEDKFSPVDKKPNYENITFTDDGLAITLETHLKKRSARDFLLF